MQIITFQNFIQLHTQAQDTAQLLFNIILPASWQNIVIQFSLIHNAVTVHDWTTLIISSLIIVGGIVIFYRLIRNNILKTFEYLRMLFSS